jgi:hypothetical protein
LGQIPGRGTSRKFRPLIPFVNGTAAPRRGDQREGTNYRLASQSPRAHASGVFVVSNRGATAVALPPTRAASYGRS